MRIVVTGATGNVGTALLRALEDDTRVTAIVGIARRLPQTTPPKTTWVAADVARDDLVPHFTSADCVVHLAWAIQPSHNRNKTWLTNVHGSRRVFAAVADAGVPALVYASSVGTYAPGPKHHRVDESWPTDGIRSSFYSRDKSDVERLLDAFEPAHPDVRVARLRTSLVFQRAMGAEVTRLFTGRLVPHRLVPPNAIPVVPNLPRLRFQVTHAADVADAYRRAILDDARGPFNIAAEPVLDPDALAELFDARKLPVPERLVRALVSLTWHARLQPTPAGWIDMALQTPLMDVTRAHTELGWTAARGADETLLELLHGFHDGAGAPTPPLAPA
jgi:UDP-glucose 4-epimerase